MPLLPGIRSLPASRVGACVLAALVLCAPAAATNLPPGFQETVLVSGISATALAWAPDGDLWISARHGDIWIYRPPGVILVTTLPAGNGGEHGVAALEIDPDFANNKHVWIYFTTAPPARNRLSRFTYDGASLTNELVLLETPPLVNFIHTGGCLQFAADGTIFLATGDDAQGAATAQDPFDIRGKILHINPDGSPAADNPFLDGTSGDPRVWAYGFRNPFGCNLQPETGNLFVGDVGQGSWEEIDIAIAGGNYGWPYVEGPQPPGQPGVVYPIYSTPHVFPGGSAVIGGDHVEPGEFSAAYEGDYFFGDYGTNSIYRMQLDASNLPTGVTTWATEASGPVYFEFGPDGSLYYSASKIDQIRKIEYIGGANSQPDVVASAAPDNGPAPLQVTLDGTGSDDPDGDSLTFLWDLDDGNFSTDASLSYSYPGGVYEPKLTVDDGNGGVNTSLALRVVSGNHRPQPTILEPFPASNYDAGQVIDYSGSASDPEDGNLACSQFAWTVIFHHLDHTHPYLGPLQGSCSGSFSIATAGETSSDTFYEIRLDVQDSGSPLGSSATLTGRQAINIHPNVSSFTLESSPLSDLTLTLDTQPVTPPLGVNGVIGFVRSIGAVSPQLRPDGHTYRWLSWSDAGAIEHDLVTPSTPTTYTATFGCDVIVPVEDVEVNDGGPGGVELGWDGVTDSCLATGPERYRIYAGSVEIPPGVPCDFPVDPPYSLVGTTSNEEFVYVPGPGEDFFRVVAVGSDGLEGPIDCTDSDGDGEVDISDNCPNVPNPGQSDSDGDTVGDACDNCPAQDNEPQADADFDGDGDVCDSCPLDPNNDIDGDGYCAGTGFSPPKVGDEDNCPTVSNSGQANVDGDAAGDACDNCPALSNSDQLDADVDGEGDVCDACTDIDGDGFGAPGFPANTCPADNCAGVVNSNQLDADGDGLGDVCDTCTDTDGDGFGNPGFPLNGCQLDNCPTLVNPEQTDEDNDNIGDPCDACLGDALNDPDMDGVCNLGDNCRELPNSGQEDFDGDGLGDVCDDCPGDADNDGDADGICGDVDNCPSVSNGDQTNSDADAFGDVCDNCPDADNPLQSDGDVDEVGDSCDNCASDFNPVQIDFDSDGQGDVCDLDDGRIHLRMHPDFFEWQEEAGFFLWNAYRGDFDVLRSTGVYTQVPGSNPLADRWCGLTFTALPELNDPGPDKLAFYLATGIGATGEGDLGYTSEPSPRPNDNPCP